MGTNTPKPNRPSRTAANQLLVAGLNKHQATLPSMVINGQSYTAAQAVTELDQIIAAANLVVTTRASWQAAVKADLAERTSTSTFVGSLKQAILVAFTGQVDVLADFGLSPRKVRVLTPEEKQAAAAKAKATRAARHTMGKNQKAAILGTTAQPSPATPAAPATPATPAAPPHS